MAVDRFGNPHAPNLPYARGKILAGTEDDFAKLEVAWSWIRRRGPGSIHIFTGLEHSLPLAAEELAFADDEIAPALYFERLKELAFRHLGGSPDLHDIAVFNRLTGATMATHLTLVRPGDVVIGVSESHSHPSVVRAAEHSRARFIDTAGLAAFHDAMAVERSVALVVLTRLAVTYDLMPIAAIRAIVELAHDKGALVYMDDAGGARVGPAAFEQPRMLELGVDIGATGLDKYGTKGPRLGLLAGRKDLVAKIRAKSFEFGMEARQMLYPAVVRTLEQYERSASCCAGKSKNTRDATKSHPDRRRRESLQRPRVRAQTHRRAGSNPPRSDRPICPPRSFRLRRKGRAAWQR